MASFIRRFLFDPGNEVLLEIESVNILDLEPPATISGVGTGTVIIVGEFENGPFEAVTEVTSATDMVNTFGSLGYVYGGVAGNNASARTRKADSAVNGETWNGNAIVQLNAKRFKRLLCVRADTSVGVVQFTRQASITGAASFAYNMEPAQVLTLDLGGGSVTATFSATAATVTAVGGVFPSTFVGGETLTLGYDDAANNFTVTFLAADQSIAQVIARINQYAGFTFADNNAGQIRLTGIRRGTGGQVRVVSGSAGVLAQLGFTAANTNGTGNVSNIDAVSFTEIKNIVQAAVSGVTVEQDSAGRLRISKVFVDSKDYIFALTTTTATALGFTPLLEGTAAGNPIIRSTAGTYPTLFAGGETLTVGVDDQPNVIVTFAAGDQTLAQVIAKINTFFPTFTFADTPAATILRFTGPTNGGQIRVVSASAPGVLTTLGLVVETVQSTGVQAGVVPAGSQVQNTAASKLFVTMQDVNVTVANAGPYTVKIRHAVDDGTGVSATAGTLTVLTNAPDLASFAVVNPSLVTAALAESAIDAKYVTAIDKTLDLNTEARTANIIFSARQSNQIRSSLRGNAIDASASGMFGRMAVIRPPLGTTRAAAESNVAQPGVGATRDQRVIYCYPGANTFIPIVALRGSAGGTGFTADGNVDTGADGFMASILSQLPPEENPGQQTPFTTGVNSVESSPNAQGFTITDYTNFRSKGIAALRVADGVAIFQSGVTSVDPAVFPNLRNIARRRMADFIQDTLALRSKSFGKKLSTVARRNALSSEIRTFMNGLLSKNNPASQRIDAFSVDDKTGNTPDTLAQGIYRIILKVRTLASLDSIVLQTTIGESVQVDEAA